jgi:hypothetical protein
MDANSYHPLMHDRGRGPELRSTRLTVYNVWGELFNPDITEHELCRRYEISPHEVAVLRAFAFQHFEEVAAKIRAMDERTERGVAEQAITLAGVLRGSGERFNLLKQWYAEQRVNPELFPDVPGESDADRRARLFRLFDEWVANLHRQPAGVV